MEHAIGMWHSLSMLASEGAVRESAPTVSRRLAMYWYVGAAFLSGLGLLGKTSLLARFAHLPVSAVVPVVVISPALAFFWPVGYRFKLAFGSLVGILLLGCFLFVFPRVQDLHKEGRGSDQPDCIVVAAHRMGHVSWPYVAGEMSSKNPLSCGPGWVALQAPAVDLLSYSWNLLLCWALCVVVLGCMWGWGRTAALLSFLGLSVGTWLCAANGSDFLSFGIVLSTFWVVVQHRAVRRGLLLTCVLTTLLGLFVQFRIPTMLVPALFFRRFGRVPSTVAFAIALMSTVLFLLWNPSAFIHEGPLHIGVKLLRTAVLSDHAGRAALEIVIVALIGFGVTASVAQRARTGVALLVFLSLIFVLPAAQNLLIQYHQHGTVLDAFQYWEGGMWIETLVPLAAVLLVEAIRPQCIEDPKGACGAV